MKDLELVMEALNSRGWEILVERFTEQYDMENMVTAIKTQSELDFVRGRLSVLMELRNLKDEVKEALDEGAFNEGDA